jgi:hypothetical protein
MYEPPMRQRLFAILLLEPSKRSEQPHWAAPRV